MAAEGVPVARGALHGIENGKRRGETSWPVGLWAVARVAGLLPSPAEFPGGAVFGCFRNTQVHS